jgi:hypothetical protein
MARRTVRKLTCWSDEEWRRVADAARPAGVPPLRFVREAALEKAGNPPSPPPRRQRTAADELVHQLARVMSNLRQMQRVAEDEWDYVTAALLGGLIEATDKATAAAPAHSEGAAAVLAVLIPAGVALNEMAHLANATGELPPYAEVSAILSTLHAALRPCLA